MSPYYWTATYFTFLNASSAFLFYCDKKKAIEGKWRIPENTLYLCAIFGGWPGGMWAMNKFRHKTKKEKFKTSYYICAFLNTSACVALGVASRWNPVLPLRLAHRYDSRTTIFSRDGRLYQVEYAMEAITQAGTCVGILTKSGVVLAAQRRVVSKLLDTTLKTEKMYKIDSHISVAVAGITSDANVMINFSQKNSQHYTYMYQEPCPVEHLVRCICDLKQAYTQLGGQRPFGISFLYAGWDKHLGFQLYASDPSGNYGGWLAFSVGSGKQEAESILKQEYKEDLTLDEAKELAIRVLSKTMDSTTLSSQAVITRKDDQIINHIYTLQEVDDLIASIHLEKEK